MAGGEGDVITSLLFVLHATHRQAQTQAAAQATDPGVAAAHPPAPGRRAGGGDGPQVAHVALIAECPAKGAISAWQSGEATYIVAVPTRLILRSRLHR